MSKLNVVLTVLAAAAWAAGPTLAPEGGGGTVGVPAGPTVPAVEGVPPAVVATGPGADEADADAGEVVLLNAGEGGCTFEVRIPEPSVRVVEGGGRRYQRLSLPSFGPEGEAGAPEMLARHVDVAAPPGADVAVTVERVTYAVRAGVELYPRPRYEVTERHGEKTLDEVFDYNPRAYEEGVYPRDFARIADQGIMRGYRVLDVAVYPYQYDAARGTLKVARSVVVRVTFVGGVRRPNAEYPARPEEEGMFSRIIPATVLNWEAAARWPFAGVPRPVTLPGISPASFADLPACKMVVEKDRLYRVTYDDLREAGFPVADVNPSRLRLYAGDAKALPRDFNYQPPGLTELPCFVSGESDGRFDPGDYVEFYGHGCDFFEAAPAGYAGTLAFSKDKYTKYNVYWLVAGNAAGKRTLAHDVKPDGGVKPGYFLDRIHAEEDNNDVGTSGAIGQENEDDEYWYWREIVGPTDPSELGSFNVVDPAPEGGDSRFEIMVRDYPGYSSNGPHHSRVYVNYAREGNKILDEIYSAPEETHFNKTIPTTLFNNGSNALMFEELNDQAVEYDFMMVDHYEFEYPRRLKAYQDYLAFANRPGINGKILFEVKGFTSDQLVLYDLTRGRRLTGFEVKAEGGSYTLRFTDDVPTGLCRYVAASAEQASLGKPLDLYMDAGSAWHDFDENVDQIIVTYDAYYDNVQPLANFRRAQGKSVIVARVTDVYDEYSWGLFDPGAIRQFVKDLYFKAVIRPGGRLPDSILLVGDAWTNWRDTVGRYPGAKLWRDFGLNQVPTYYFWTASNGRSASDNVFASMSNSLWPDMAVGRFAAPFDENIDAIVDKVLDYERQPFNSPWLGRVLMTADNDDINKEGGGGEGNFTGDNEGLEANFAPWGFEVRKENIEWLNRHYVDPIWGGFDKLDRNGRKADVRKFMKPNYLRSFDALILHYAGHGGPQVWAHETLYAHHKDNPMVDDVYKLENDYRLPVICQCSCSTAYFDFDLQVFSSSGRDSDQSISEYTLQSPRTGAVATMGSTRMGTEPGQAGFMKEFYRYIFPGREVRSEGITVGEAHFSAKVNAHDQLIRDIFVLLGDPATTIAVPRPGLTLTPGKSTVKRGGSVRVTGTVPGGFNGKATVQLFDRPWYYHSRINSSEVYRDRLLSTTEVEVVNGRFEATVVVPTVPASPGPSLGGALVAAAAAAAPAAAGAATASPGVVAAGPAATAPAPAVAAEPYVESDYEPVAEDGTAYVKAVAYGTGFRQTYICNDEVKINVQGEVASGDKQGPHVDVYLDDYSFRSGDPTSPRPKLIVEVRDESGVLTARSLEPIGQGEQTFLPLYMRVDNDAAPTDLTLYYKPKYNDYRAGSIEKDLTLGQGTHTLTISAYDNLGNRTDKAVTCVVSGALGLTAVMNCPNPFPDDTYFTFAATSDIDALAIKVYTATGRLIKKIETGGFPAGFTRIYWDGRDNAGDAIANGVYFYTITARTGDQKVVIREKLVKMR